ncbi:MAG: hypothetical protein ACRC2K_13085 [Clostridium sp.]
MGKDIITTIPVERFDFEEFLTEIRRNLSRELNGDFIPKYMEEISEGEYIDIPNPDYEGLPPNIIYKDISKNNRILYVSFIYNCQTYGTGGFLCGDGQELDPNIIYYGEVIHDDCGFIVQSKNGELIFKKGNFGGRIEEDHSASLVNNVGDFQYIMEEFLEKFTY